MGRPRTDIRARVLHAARARFLVDGVDGASLRMIAKEAKTSIGMIFYYYPTKDLLFLAVVEEVYAKLIADLEALLSEAAPLRDRLRRAFARLGHASAEELDVVRLVVREALVSSPRLHDLLSRFRRGHIGMLLGALADGVARGELDGAIPPPFLLIATMAIGGAPQIVRRIGQGELPFSAMPDPDRLAAASVDLLFRAIGAPPKTEPRPKQARAKSKRRRGGA
jgi:TetR/AcrR family transcriptional regulator